MGIVQKMSECKNGCNESVICDVCGKQLCKAEKVQSDSVIKKQCANAGCYRFADETICIECYTTQRRRPIMSTHRTRPSS